MLTWNSAEYVERCLGSVVKDIEQSGLTYEILIVDNGSSDETRALIDKFVGRISVIPLGSNTGTTFSRNIALRLAKGRFVAVLDSDMEITEQNTLSRLCAYLTENPHVGIVSPRLIYPSGKHQKSVDVFPTLSTKLRRYFRLREMELAEGSRVSASSPPCEVDYSISAFWLFRRCLMEDIGYLDEKIFYAPEDVDYCLRAWLSGRPVVYLPSICAMHHAQEISRRGFMSKSMRLHIAGLAYYFGKFGVTFSRARIYKRIENARLQRQSQAG